MSPYLSLKSDSCAFNIVYQFEILLFEIKHLKFSIFIFRRLTNIKLLELVFFFRTVILNLNDEIIYLSFLIIILLS